MGDFLTQPTASLGETSPPRYEVKIPLPAAMRHEVESWVRLHPAHWLVAYPPRQVNNIYFDSMDFSGLNANLAGIADRTKLRLRWYGEDLARVHHANLELKRKQGMAGWKVLAGVKGGFDLEALSWSDFCAILRSAIVPQAQQWLNALSCPVLVNHYHRAYYVTPDGALRLTVDTDLCAYSQRASSRPNLRRLASMENPIVVELKMLTHTRAMQRFSDALRAFPASVDRFSKYVHGMLAGMDG